MAYRYRLGGVDPAWRETHGRQVEYRDLAIGEYIFEVRAVDRDLNYSDPARVALRVVADPRQQALSQALSGPAEDFVGSSPAIRSAQAQLEEVARTDLTVLILGETGTGKGLAARLVHRLSARSAGPFIQVNCGALPEGLVESELFGHEKGAFTGAVARRLGKVELAEGGTLFLDEIGDLSPAAQAKLLEVLEERTFMRVGGSQPLRAQVRVVAATNRDLAQMVGQGAFREDLYYRLQGFPVTLPPLRQRRGDIAALAHYFMVRMATHLSKHLVGLEPEAADALLAYPWPGNVRELEHVVQRAVVVCRGARIGVGDLAPGAATALPAASLCLRDVERRHIEGMLARTGGVVKGPGGAAEILGIPASTLYHRMAKLGIVRP
ncbi:MAG: sigma 54-interacting transcriptional regulator [Candidatus Latescibacterota bacterium]